MTSVLDSVPQDPVGLVTNSPDLLSNVTIAKLTETSKQYLTSAGYPVAFIASPILPLILLSLMNQKHSPDTKSEFRSEYDYIIVGAGSAGSVVASRLSEICCVSVLLLEAGKTSPLLTDVPELAPTFYRSDIDWNYLTVPQNETGSGLNNREFPWITGKTVGGTSALNAMFAVRGNRKNYDDWAAMGATGWNYEEVLPYFFRLENTTVKKFLENGYHATGGPITLELPRYEATIKQPLAEAFEHLDYQFVDYNAETQTGVSDFLATMRKGQRCSVAKGYLVPAEKRCNLDIVEKAMVRKILIENKRAIGVEFDFNETTHHVYARKEVILSAGAVGSPKLLMLSGIGPKEHLEEFNISVVSDLTVGDNLQDHVASAVLLSLDITKVAPDIVDIENPAKQLSYIENKTDKFAGTFGGPLLAFLNNAGPHPDVDFPDFELYFIQAPDFVLNYVFNMNPEFYLDVFGTNLQQPFIMCLSQLLQPKSRGIVRLKSADPYDNPIIDPMYYTSPEDILHVIGGMKVCRRLCNSPSMKALGCQEFKPYPDCVPYVEDEDKYFECMLRVFSVSIWHYTCTAKMGNPDDPTTVVDPELRVKGIDGLRVVDASVMPLLVSGNTNLPTMMIAEKVSDMIKKTISCKRQGQYGVQYPAMEKKEYGQRQQRFSTGFSQTHQSYRSYSRYEG